MGVLAVPVRMYGCPVPLSIWAPLSAVPRTSTARNLSRPPHRSLPSSLPTCQELMRSSTVLVLAYRERTPADRIYLEDGAASVEEGFLRCGWRYVEEVFTHPSPDSLRNYRDSEAEAKLTCSL